MTGTVRFRNAVCSNCRKYSVEQVPGKQEHHSTRLLAGVAPPQRHLLHQRSIGHPTSSDYPYYLLPQHATSHHTWCKTLSACYRRVLRKPSTEQSPITRHDLHQVGAELCAGLTLLR